ncbi:hypothetical protein [Pseudomonas sp. GL-RE-20]|uniref:hypothetical protein n=1 Tax=Pseudomonas sp. GL-RE-20 TaxID=2832372 RepID=UPI001CBE3FF1|nr:hypothetical protein [Pseudomonas sp. GL-RE-20]
MTRLKLRERERQYHTQNHAKLTYHRQLERREEQQLSASMIGDSYEKHIKSLYHSNNAQINKTNKSLYQQTTTDKRHGRPPMKNEVCSILRSIDPVASYEAAINERSDNVKSNTSGRTKRSVAIHTAFWEPGRTLKIAMYDENQKTIDIVKNIANKWLAHANLKFEFISGTAGDIRIKIEPNQTGDSYSFLGTDALTCPPEEPTMKIGVALEHDEFERFVLHEFGHALGLRHEHQHPDADIPWDLEKVYAWYKEKSDWERDNVDLQVLPLPRYTDHIYGDYDPLSVMHYKIDSTLTLNNWSHPGNFTLSKNDMNAIRKIYPQRTTYIPHALIELFNIIKAPFIGKSN